jgi:hypothetical protein
VASAASILSVYIGKGASCVAARSELSRGRSCYLLKKVLCVLLLGSTALKLSCYFNGFLLVLCALSPLAKRRSWTFLVGLGNGTLCCRCGRAVPGGVMLVLTLCLDVIAAAISKQFLAIS